MAKYVVLSDALVVSTGVKKKNGRPETARVLRGGVLDGKEDSESIADLLRRKVIAKVSSKAEAAKLSAKHLTVREIAKASGAEDDPVEAPKEEVLPVAPSGGHVDPGSLTADDADADADAGGSDDE